MNLAGDQASSTTTTPSTGRHGPALAAVTVLFFMWGFLTCLNDILVPHLKNVFDLGFARGALVQFSFFSAYFLVSLPAGKIVAKVGYKRGILIGLVVSGIGALLFYPAASLPSYAFFLSALFVLAAGIAFLQVAANPYVAVLGPKEGAPSRLNLTQAFNALGTTLAPFFGGYLFLASGAARGSLAEAHAVRVPYLGLALTLFLLALGLAFFKLPRIVSAEGDTEGHPSTIRDALRIPHVALGVVAIFLYVGAEVSIGSFLVNFLEQPTIGALDSVSAAKHVSYYWGGAMVGRFIGSVVLRRVDAGRLLAACAAVASTLVVVALVTSGTFAMWSLLAVGLFNSIMFPTIFTLTLERSTAPASATSGLLVFGIIGGALLPLVAGSIADSGGNLNHAFIVPLIGYVLLTVFAVAAMRTKPVTAAGVTASSH